MPTDHSGQSAGLAALQLVLEEEHYRAMPAEDLLGRYLSERDERAFAALVRRYGRLVMARCREILRHEDLAQEAFQETFTQLVINAHRVRKRGAVGRWLARTASRRSLNIARRERRQRARDLGAPRDGKSLDAAAIVAAQDAGRAVAHALSALPERLRLPIELIFLDGMTHAEAASALGCPKGTIDSSVRRGLARMKTALARLGAPAITLGATGWSSSVEAVPPNWIESTVIRAGTMIRRQPIPAVELAFSWKALALVGSLGLAVGLGVAVWPDSPAQREPEPPPPPPPTPAAAVESLQAQNKRIVQDELAGELRDIVQKFYPADNVVRIADVRAFGAEVVVELETTFPPPTRLLAQRLALSFCTFRRKYAVHGQPAGDRGWYSMNPEKPLVIPMPPAFGVPKEIVLGRDEYASSQRLFDKLPRDARAEDELLRYLFGTPNSRFVVPAGGTGYAADSGRIYWADGGSLFVRDQSGAWRFGGDCPGWWPVVHDGQLYCMGDRVILTRPIDALLQPCTFWKKIPELKPGERGGSLAIAGDRLYFTIHPNVHCYCPLADPKAPWGQYENSEAIWPEIAATADRFFGRNSTHLLTRPVRDIAAPWKPLARWPENGTSLVVDGNRLLVVGKPGPIYSRPITAGPDVEFEIVGETRDLPWR